MKRRSHISLSLALISSLVVISTYAMNYSKENIRNTLSVSTDGKKNRLGTGNFISRIESPAKNKAEIQAHIKDEINKYYETASEKQAAMKEELAIYHRQLREYLNYVRAENS